MEPWALPRGASVHRYLVIDRIGEGGMAVVYAAYDSSLDRRVALKFLRPHAADLHGVRERRLLREGKAMARLSHSNVAVVYEVGTFHGHVFLAMEFVDGVDLRTWLGEKPRSAAEILEVFVAAGRGLEAAHAAGIIHRDFKPENVLMDTRGRPRVTDFGLSRASHEQGESPPPPAGSTSPSPLDAAGDTPPLPTPATSTLEPPSRAATPAEIDGAPALSLSMTRTGAVLGTPAYMSPEQHRAESIGVRSDQFSFCVALYEALYGVRPFSGTTAREVLDNVVAGRLSPPVRDAPRWIRPLLARGLDAQAERRWPSLDALLERLARDPAARRRRWLLAGGTLAAAAALTVGLLPARERTPLCQGAAAQVAGVWDAAARERVGKAFAATGSPLAADVFARVDRTMGDRLTGWAAAHKDACEATHMRGDQSPAMLDLRMQCLGRSRRQLGALVELWKREPVDLEKAIEAAVRVGPVDVCADTEALAAPIAPPGDAQAAARLEPIRARLDDVAAHFNAGRLPSGVALARDAEAAAVKAGYAPLIGEAKLLHASFLSEIGKRGDAVNMLNEALRAAAEARDDVLVSRALSRLVSYLAIERRFLEADTVASLAEAAVARAGNRDELMADMLRFKGTSFLLQGRFTEALPLQKRALEFYQRLGPQSPGVASALGNIATCLARLGQLDEASEYYARGVALHERNLGPDHYRVSTTLRNWSIALCRMGDYDGCGRTAERALAIAEKIYPAGHPKIADNQHTLGVARGLQGRMQEARELWESAERIRVAALGADHPHVASTWVNLASLALDRAELDTARRLIDSAVRSHIKANGPDHPGIVDGVTIRGQVLAAQKDWKGAEAEFARAIAIQRKEVGGQPGIADALTGLGIVRVHQRRYREAIALHEEARAILEQVTGAENPYLTVALVPLGDAYLAAGRKADAVTTLARAVAIGEKSGAGIPVLARARFHFARALWATGQRRRALSLARAARSQLAGTPNRVDLAEAERWLRVAAARR